MMGFNVPMYNPTPIQSPQNALMQGLEVQRAQQGNALQQYQLQALIQRQQQEQAAQARQQQFVQGLPSPQMMASQNALAGGGGPTVANAQRMQPVDPRLQMLHGAMQAGMASPMDYLKALHPEQKLRDVAPGASVLDERTMKPVFTAPDKAKIDPFVAQLQAAGIDPASPQGRAFLMDRLRKESTHTPAASIVNYGSPVPVQLPDGSTGYVQPTNRGGPVSPMAEPGGKPLVKPADQKDKDLTEAAAKATTYLGQMRSATKTLKDIGADQSALSMQAETALAGGPMNIAIRDKAQRVRQSQDQWSEAFLRFKTGAASTPAEVAANRKTFFPVLGDKPETIQQKAQMRLQAERDLEIPAGRGARQLSEPASPEVSAPASSAVRRFNPATGRIE